MEKSMGIYNSSLSFYDQSDNLIPIFQEFNKIPEIYIGPLTIK